MTSSSLQYLVKFAAGLFCILYASTALCFQAVVYVEPAQVVDFQGSQSLIGSVVSEQFGPIASDVSGKVEKVLVQVGEQVVKGQPLVQLDKTRLALAANLADKRAAMAKAELQSSEIAYEQATLNLKRQQSLAGTPGYSKALVEDLEKALSSAKAEWIAKEADYAWEQAQLELAQYNLAQATIRAPYAGIMTEERVEAGNYVQPGDAVVTLVNDVALEIEMDVPKNLVDKLSLEQELSIPYAEKIYTATVRAIVRQENTASRTLSVRLVPDNALKAVLIVDQTITVPIPIQANQQFISVHKDGLINRQGQFFVYVAEEGKAVLKPVQLLEPVGDRYIINQGLQSGDQVIVRGNERLRPNQSVMAKPNSVKSNDSQSSNK